MLYGITSARLKYIVEADDIRFDIYVGICYRVSNARLRREVNYNREALFLKKSVDELLISNRALNKSKGRLGEALGELIYFFEKACAISGYVLGVNPFNQPGVESYKKNMFALLGKPGYEELAAVLSERLGK